MIRFLLLVLLVVLLQACAGRMPAGPFADGGDPTVAAVVRDMCGREVAALGEPAGHGDARATEFKTAVVQALVERCGFDAIFFEGSSYDFLELERRQKSDRPVTREMLASAVGGLWNRYEEMQPLISWIHARMAGGGLRLGGVDDQLGSAGAFYSISEMPAELSGVLAAPRAGACREEFRRVIYGEAGPSPTERAPLLACVAEIRARVETGGGGSDRAELLHMLDNVERYASRGRPDEPAATRARDHSMWLNYQWLRGRLPAGSKVILWGATVHLARDATASQGFAGGDNFGAYLDRFHGRRAFFLGFTAAGGSYRSGGSVKTIAPIAHDALEARALAAGAAQEVYLRREELAALGMVEAGAFAHDRRVTADWSRAVDGLVVFRTERAPAPVPPVS